MPRLRESLNVAAQWPETLGLDGRYVTFVAFVNGIDVGKSGQWLSAFGEWFQKKHNVSNLTNIAWFGQIARVYLPEFASRNVGYENLTVEDSEFLISRALTELLDFSENVHPELLVE
jgi:hypothetical protein